MTKAPVSIIEERYLIPSNSRRNLKLILKTELAIFYFDKSYIKVYRFFNSFTDFFVKIM